MSIYASNKALFSEAMSLYAKALDNGNDKRAAELRVAIDDAYNSAIDSLEDQHNKRVELAMLEPPKPQFICSLCVSKLNIKPALT